VLKTFLFSQY